MASMMNELMGEGNDSENIDKEENKIYSKNVMTSMLSTFSNQVQTNNLVDYPEFPVGTEVTLTADHMEGMEGATATISGAFDTTTYSVSFTPTDGGEPVTDHKWVVHEELENPGEAPLAEGTEVVITADHMTGMEGAEATIDSATEETVYMVDYEADGMMMTNHKWVVESEIEPA